MSQKSTSSYALPPASQFSGNRNIVIVDQEILNINDSTCSLEVLDESFTTSESSSASRQLLGVSRVTESSASFQTEDKDNYGFLCSCLDEFQIPSQLEDLVDRLGLEIEQASIGYEKTLSDLKEIPSLRKKIDSLIEENKSLAGEVIKKAAMIESLNDRLSLLQEQNIQLAQLSHTSVDQSATLSMRNSLVASLTQLKKLQAQVDEIPELKNKVSSLTEDLKQKETTGLQLANTSEPPDFCPRKLEEKMSHLASLIENLSTRLKEYEKSHSLENIAFSCQKKMEELLAPLMKSKKFMLTDSSESEVVNNCISLLSKDLLQKEIEFSKQKELLISKLFDIQYSALEVEKSEVLRSLSGISPLEKESIKSQPFKKSDSAVSGVNLLPLFQSQVSKLHQIRLIYRHSKSSWAAIKPCYKEHADIGSIGEKYVLQEFKRRAAVSEENLSKAQPNVFDGSISSDHIWQSDERWSIMKKEIAEEKRMHKNYLKKYKKEKEKLKGVEEKYLEVCVKLQVIATELTQSAALLQKFQIQCEELEVEKNKIQSVNRNLMEDYDKLQAKCSEFFYSNKYVNISSSNSFPNITVAMSSVEAAEVENSLIENLSLSICTLEESVPSEFKVSFFGAIIMKIDNAMKEIASTHELVLEKLKKEVSETQINTLKREINQLVSEKSGLQEELVSMKCKHQDIFLDLQSQLKLLHDKLEICQTEKETLHINFSAVNTLVNTLNRDLEARNCVCLELEKENDNLRVKLFDKDQQRASSPPRSEKECQCDSTTEPGTFDTSTRESLELKITILESKLEKYEEASYLKSQRTQTPQMSVTEDKLTQTDMQHTRAGDENENHGVSLNEYNFQLENQVSVLSQWNDKQHTEIEGLEIQVQNMYKELDKLQVVFKNQEDLAQENAHLQQELREVEDELKMLRKVANLDIQEDLQMQVDTQAFLVMSLNEKNQDLHKQVCSIIYVILQVHT